jgi:integrase
MATMARAGYSPNTIRLARSVLRRSLGHAERSGLVVRNVAALAQGSGVPRPTARPLTVEEVRALLGAARGDRHEAAIILLVETGMRLGELLGLRWEDVDLDGGQLQIRQTLSSVGGRMMLSESKTATSRRPYELGDVAVRALRSHRRRQATERLAAGRAWAGCDHVIATEVGTPVDSSNSRRRFGRIATSAGIDGCPPTSFATLRRLSCWLGECRFTSSPTCSGTHRSRSPRTCRGTWSREPDDRLRMRLRGPSTAPS